MEAAQPGQSPHEAAHAKVNQIEQAVASYLGELRALIDSLAGGAQAVAGEAPPAAAEAPAEQHPAGDASPPPASPPPPQQ